ncbi:hypothetical protein [Amycolatopsis taiwanensis]|uniref:hypothetical protein n=1 Tax=Amycolatopsis taiwanensis TaxID=342230 RepID=UPI0025569B00|nr:hypothetical protein [Amycolatopsis taiwanensis]
MHQPGPQPAWPAPPSRRSNTAAVLAGVSLWRLLIVVFAFVGFGAAVADAGGLGNAMPGLSQQASLLTGIAYLGLLAYPLFTGGRRHEPRSPWLRGALTVLLLLVGITFLTLMGGDLDEAWSLFEHLLTPLAVLADWIFVGRNQSAVRWWHPLTWVVFPLAYLLYFLAADLRLYGSFLNPHKSSFAGTVIGFLCAVVAAGYLLYGIAKLKTVVAGNNTPGTRVPQANYPPRPGYPQPGNFPYQPGYPPQTGYPPGYPPQTGYPQPPGYPPQTGSPQQPGNPPQTGNMQQPGNPPQPGPYQQPPGGGWQQR